MRNVIALVPTAVFAALFFCCKDASIEPVDELVVGPMPPGAYAYTAYDSTGPVVVTGWLSFVFQDSAYFTGRWEFQRVGNPQRIGPQVGRDSLVGGIEAGIVWVSLNPQVKDNNVFLNGQFDENRYHGVWLWITLAGVENQGPFDAIKN